MSNRRTPVLILAYGAIRWLGASALAEEGVRVTGSKLPYILGGIGAIALGVVLMLGMIASKDGRTVVVTPTGLPIPMPLFPLAIGIIVGLVLFNLKPSDSYTLNGIRYSLNEQNAVALGFAKGAEVPDVLELPAEVEGLPVTGVGGFAGTRIRELVLPAGTIYDRAFRGCTELISVTFRQAKMHIGIRAFDGCTSLETVRFPEAEEGGGQIENQAFRGCAALTTVNLPEGKYKLGFGVFENCGALISVGFSASTTVGSLDTNCFKNCTSLTGIDVNVTDAVGDSAFRNCTALNVARLGGVKTIGAHAFEGCTGLRCVEGREVDGIENRAFADCPALEGVSARLRDNPQKIAKNAFEGSPNVLLYTRRSDLAEKAGVTSTEAPFFYSETLSDGTLRLTGFSFGGSESVFTVPAVWCGLPVSEADLYAESDAGNQYNHEEIVVENGIRRLDDNCFLNWGKNLRRLRLPDSVEYIGENLVPKRINKNMTLYTSNPLAAAYGEEQGWTVKAR